MREHMLISIIAMVGFYGLITIYQDLKLQPKYARTYIKHHFPNDGSASASEVEKASSAIQITHGTSNAVDIHIADFDSSQYYYMDLGNGVRTHLTSSYGSYDIEESSTVLIKFFKNKKLIEAREFTRNL